jgi:hypothetical protein
MGDSELITVYRSADQDAEDDAAVIRDLLSVNGLSPVVVDDQEPGVVSGTYEVRVPTSEAARAEEVLAANKPVVDEELDPSHELDMVPIFHSDAATSEMEALAIKGILDSNGIEALVVGNSTLPNLGFEVHVPREQQEPARAAIAEAQAAGPMAAEEAERAGENPAD